MKKGALLLITLLVAGPVFGLLCHCCPMAHAETSSQPILSAEGCHCCGQALVSTQREIAVQTELRSLLASSFTHLLFLSAATPSPSRIESSPASSNEVHTGPPQSHSKTPLYLSLEVLRI